MTRSRLAHGCIDGDAECLRCERVDSLTPKVRCAWQPGDEGCWEDALSGRALCREHEPSENGDSGTRCGVPSFVGKAPVCACGHSKGSHDVRVPERARLGSCNYRQCDCHTYVYATDRYAIRTHVDVPAGTPVPEALVMPAVRNEATR